MIEFFKNSVMTRFYILGDRARFPLKLRPKGLVTASIVVADIKEHKNAVKDHDSVFVYANLKINNKRSTSNKASFKNSAYLCRLVFQTR